MSALVRSYTVGIAGYPSEYETVVVAKSAGAAKYQRWIDARECAPDLPFTAMRARVGPGFLEPAGFRRCVEYRQIPFVTVGMRVRSDDGDDGVIVGHNSSANLDILFVGGRWDGQTHNCHPAWAIRFFVDGSWRRSPQALGQQVPSHWEAL